MTEVSGLIATGTMSESAAAAERALAEHGGVGASLALMVDDDLVLATGVGRRDPARPDPPSPEDEFHVYSVGKTVIACAAMRLAEQGALDLDAPIARVLPGLGLPEAVTLRRLLNHTAGVPDYSRLHAYHDAVRDRPERPWSASEFLALTLGQQQVGPVGTFAYSNIGYLLVRLAMERVTDLPLGEVLRTEVFAPMGAHHLRLASCLDDVAGLAPGWSRAFGDGCMLVNVAQRYHPGWVAHGAVVGRAADVARTLDGLVAGRLVGPASLAAMLVAVPVEGPHWLFQPPGYGLGLMTDHARSDRCLVGHGGAGPGYATGALCFLPEAGPRTTAVVLSNTDEHPDLGLRLAWSLIEGCRIAGP